MYIFLFPAASLSSLFFPRPGHVDKCLRGDPGRGAHFLGWQHFFLYKSTTLAPVGPIVLKLGLVPTQKPAEPHPCRWLDAHAAAAGLYGCQLWLSAGARLSNLSLLLGWDGWCPATNVLRRGVWKAAADVPKSGPRCIPNRARGAALVADSWVCPGLWDFGGGCLPYSKGRGVAVGSGIHRALNVSSERARRMCVHLIA
ncbi:hypothetical protein MAPG_10774 [Magnaporthiopsis poae ATCC 64411]|uniref:Uncharacterized protein n=1 Tax=Magnaporthiopsis poae (strain ATCC 64411 / 73-15) TaxID=644358 RepID=A0A0C4EDH5_MAGP6|nr:hypothetical protein MAPG_10774 [Magnaporthiopsis poae ATCC 64411]